MMNYAEILHWQVCSFIRYAAWTHLEVKNFSFIIFRLEFVLFSFSHAVCSEWTHKKATIVFQVKTLINIH